MPDISSIGHGSMGPIERAARMQSAHANKRKTTSNGHGVAGDRVEVSQHARLMQRLRELPEVRVELIERVRRDMAGGAYESPSVIDAAIERLIQEVTG